MPNSCESQGHDPQIARAALPPEPIPKSGIGSGLLAHVIVSKMVDHLPLHRQEGILARHGWDVRRSTLCDHLRTCGELLTPLYDLMRQRLLQSFAIHADDTPLVLLRPRRTAFAWVYLGDESNPYTLFDLTAGRRQEFPQRFLAGYRGFVHADAYDGYNGVHNNVRHLGCWMHARRYFVEAEPTDPRAVEALAFIRTLYAVEREVKDERERHGSTFTDATWCGCGGRGPGQFWPRSPTGSTGNTDPPRRRALFGQAVAYSRRPVGVRSIRYLDDKRFAIDNGAAERAIRPLAIGRGNWLHVGGDGGLKTASLSCSASAPARCGIVSTRGRTCATYSTNLAVRSAGADLSDLLPDAPAQAREPTRRLRADASPARASRSRLDPCRRRMGPVTDHSRPRSSPVGYRVPAGRRPGLGDGGERGHSVGCRAGVAASQAGCHHPGVAHRRPPGRFVTLQPSEQRPKCAVRSGLQPTKLALP